MVTDVRVGVASGARSGEGTKEGSGVLVTFSTLSRMVFKEACSLCRSSLSYMLKYMHFIICIL